jgi:hypothetical protein
MMNERELRDVQRRQFALEKAVGTSAPYDSAVDILAKAEAFDAFLRGDPAKAD